MAFMFLSWVERREAFRTCSLKSVAATGDSGQNLSNHRRANLVVVVQ